MRRSQLWPYRSRGYRLPVRLPALAICIILFVVFIWRSEQNIDRTLVFSAKVKSINAIEIDSATFMSVATPLKTSKPSFTGQQSSVVTKSETKSLSQSTTMALPLQLDSEGLRGQIRTKGHFIPTGFRFVNDGDVRSALDVLDANIETAKRQDSSSDWDTKRFLLIVTTWRSGSTFLSEIMAHHPAVFLHYEPLVHLGRRQVRTEQQNTMAVQHLKDLFNCKYSNKDYNLKIKRITQDLIGHNVHVWNACVNSTNPSVCKESSYLEAACRRFPVVLAKVVRLRLASAGQLLAQMPNLKIIFLIRDPRALMSSRYQVADWGCDKYRDCSDPNLICQDALSDLNALEALSVSHPGRSMLVKYETLALEPRRTFQEIFRFAQLPYSSSVDRVVGNRTSTETDDPWSIYRKSSAHVDLWKTKLDRQKIDSIQTACSQVLHRLNYSLV